MLTLSDISDLLCSYFSFIIAVWPIWGWLSIALAFITFIAIMFLPNLVPSC